MLYSVFMDNLNFLCEPIVCGLAMALVSWLIFDFWQDVLSVRHKRIPANVAKIVVALFNGLSSYAAEVFTQNNASPRTIAIYMPIMIVLEIHILGHMKNKWGTFSIFALTSFQFISLYSATLGFAYLIMPPEFIASRFGLVLPVTLLNILLSFFLLSIKIYKTVSKDNNRSVQIGAILSDYKASFILVTYAFANIIAVTLLTYDALDMLNQATMFNHFTEEICRNMIVRDLMLFFTTVMMLDIRARAMQTEQKAKEVIADNIRLEQDIKIQNMIQKGLEAAKDDLEKKSQKLESQLEHEKKLRNSLHRNILFRFSCNVTKGIIDDTGALKADVVNITGKPLFDDIVKMFLEILVHPDDREELGQKMSVKNLSSISYVEKGFNVPIRISPREFLHYSVLDDDSAKIYAYIDRDYIWTDMDCTVVTGEDGDTYAYFYIMDIDEQKQKEEIIKKAATTDALTGLLNRGAFREKLNDYLSKEGNKGGSLFMLDLDYFKSVNDNLGHPKGDELLKDVAEILNNTFRENDIICRIGGDEFCAFGKGFKDKEQIKMRAELLNEAGRKTFDLPNGKQIKVSFSIGIAVIPGDANTAKELYTNADTALYNAKESGRNCYRTYS